MTRMTVGLTALLLLAPDAGLAQQQRSSIEGVAKDTVHGIVGRQRGKPFATNSVGSRLLSEAGKAPCQNQIGVGTCVGDVRF